MDNATLFGELRSRMQQLTRATWPHIVDLLDEVEDDLFLEEVIAPYLRSQFERWPNTYPRYASFDWYGEDVPTARRRAFIELVRIPCPSCKTLCDQHQVADSLKTKYGKKYSKIVKVRELMTGIANFPWECEACRETFFCHHCEEERAFAEVVSALNQLYGSELDARRATRELLSDDVPLEWACLSCQDAGLRPLGAPPYWSSESTSCAEALRHARQHMRSGGVQRRWAVGNWKSFLDLDTCCKRCGTSDVFTAEMQRDWYVTCRIPPVMIDDWAVIDPSALARCASCNLERLTRARIRRLMATLDERDERDEEVLRALATHHDTLGERREADEFRRQADALHKPR